MGRSIRISRLAPILVGVTVALAGCQFSLGGQARANEVVLGQVSLTASDAAAGAEFAPVDNGDQVTGQVSLDLCRSDYPSEADRVARHQVQIFNSAPGQWVSSEAIAYSSPEAAAQAMTELAAAAADCQDGTPAGGSAGAGQQVRASRLGAVQVAAADRDLIAPQPSSALLAAVQVAAPAADQDLTWSFEPAPDGNWPQTPGVTRQAYAFAISDALGDSSSYVTTYLRRGRILLAVYVTPPDSAADVLVNSPTQSRLIEVMSARLASLPSADVS